MEFQVLVVLVFLCYIMIQILFVVLFVLFTSSVDIMVYDAMILIISCGLVLTQALNSSFMCFVLRHSPLFPLVSWVGLRCPTSSFKLLLGYF
ncbi:hypothetical protein RIF29_14248 [Crotalaria pallida]|uniref:Uncharacterized protein n=1 Tax=Crotalaria pallida TaxID=3830 RepID=A0AAN9FCZ2_CROPI